MKYAGITPSVLCAVALMVGCGGSPEPLSQAAPEQATVEVTPAELRERYQLAVAAYDDGEIAEFCDLTATLVEDWPAHPRLIYNLASCHALEGRSDAALKQLERLVLLRVAYDVSTDEDFSSLRELPRFSALMERLEAATVSQVVGEEAFRLEDPEFVPEDVAWDPVSDDLFVSSIRQRKIVRIDGEGRQTLFAGYPETDLFAALSMAVDVERRLLWLTTAASPSMIDYRADEHEGRSILLAFDLDTGDEIRRVEAAADGKRHELNDLSIEPDGSILIGDAPLGAVYRLRPGADSFEIVAAEGTMFSPQGIVLLPEGGEVLVADYSRGLCRLEPGGRISILPCPEDAWLGGIDGLSIVDRRELIAVQNGITPARVVRIRLSDSVDRVDEVQVLDLNHPAHDQPTLGEVVGNDFLYVANSLWGAWDREGNLVEGRELSPPVILRVRL